MPGSKTVAYLLEHRVVTYEQVDAAADAYVTNPAVTTLTIAPGLTVDLGIVVEDYEWISRTIDDPHATAGMKWGAIRTAVLLSRASKG